MEFQLNYFKYQKMILWKCCTPYASKFGKLSSGRRTGKGQFSFQPKESNAEEWWNYCTIVLISHTSKVMLKILQARLQRYMNHELPDVQLDLEKAEEPEIKLPTSVGSSKKAREFQKNIYFCFIDYAKVFDCVDHNKLWKTLKEMGVDLPPEESVCRSRSNS